MKIFLCLLLTIPFLSLAATSSKKSLCLEIYEKNYKKKDVKLISFYESDSLCGFSTEGTAKEAGGVGGLLQGNWETIISKDPKKAIIDVTYEELGLKDDCVHRSPIDFVNHCGEGKKFETIAKHRKEEFKFTKM